MRALLFKGIISFLMISFLLVTCIKPIPASSLEDSVPTAYWEYEKQGFIKKLPPYAIVNDTNSHLRVKVNNIKKGCKIKEIILIEEDWGEKDDPVSRLKEIYNDSIVYTPWMNIPFQFDDPGIHSEWYASILILCGKIGWKIKTPLIMVPHRKINFLLTEGTSLKKITKLGKKEIGNINTYIGKRHQRILIASVKFKNLWVHDPEGYVKLKFLSPLPFGWNVSLSPTRFNVKPNASQPIDIYLSTYTPTSGNLRFQVIANIEGEEDATDILILRSHELNLVDWTLYIPVRFQIMIPAFKMGENIPLKYSCRGLDISPPIIWNVSNLPPETKSLALIMFDPTAPGRTFIHWILYNISPTLGSLPENLPKGKKIIKDVGIQGINNFHKIGYNGPCPPPKSYHVYIFRMLALDTWIPANINTLTELKKHIKDHIVAYGDYIGFFGI